jgi:ribosomal protein L15
LRAALAARLCRDTFNSLNRERIHLPQVTAAQELQIKAEARLASLMEEKLVTRISVPSTLLGGGKTTERRISIETHKTSPDFDQAAANKAKNRIKQALGEIGCDVFIETDR